MANSSVAVTEGSGKNIDTRTTAGDGDERQVVVIGDESTDAGLAPVDATNGLAVDPKGDALTALQLIDNIVNTEDNAHSSGDSGVPMLGVRRDAKAVGSGADGDYSTLNLNGAGDLRVDGGQVFAFESAPTVTAGAYTADDCIGGEIEITNSARVSGGGGVLMQISMGIEDNDADGFAANDIDVIIFKSNPAGTYTDNTALAVTDADAFEIEGVVTLDTKLDLGDVTLLQANNINLPYVCDATSLFAVAVNRGGKTPEATDAIQLRFKMLRD